MDRNCPDGYVESTSASIANTKSFLDHFAYLSSSHSVPKIAANSSQPYSPALPPLVQPIITPRFALSCADRLLASLGQLASSFTPSLPIQTHLSENPAEVRQALELFPECRTYAGVYENFNLLGPGTILAHCVHLSEDERVVIMRTGSGVSHCPTSNLHLNSGMARVKALLDLGIKVCHCSNK